MERYHNHKNPSGPKAFWLTILLLLTLCSVSSAQERPVFEEIVISLEVPRLLSVDIFVQYDGNTVFVPIIDIFTALEFNVSPNFDTKVISGFIQNEKNKFYIDLNTLKIETDQGDYHLLPSEYYLGQTDLYIKVDLYEQIFGIKTVFDFSNLTVSIPFSNEFPAYQRLKRKSQRKKLAVKKEALKDIRHLTQERELINGAVIDWTLGTNPLDKNGQHYTLSTGSVIGGGDLYLNAAGRTQTKFDLDQFTYKWHYYLQKAPYLTQVDLGHHYSPGALGHLSNGMSLTNRPQVRRKFFQTTEVSGYIGANWEVELWVDNKLTDYIKTDAKGDYSFTIDIFYGSSVIELKMYGPNGELKTEERFFRVPYNLIPKNKIEYNLSLGRSEVNGISGNYAQNSTYYGILDRMTAGLSIDLPISSTSGEKPTLATEITGQPTNNITLSGTFSPNNKAEGSFNFNLPSIINANGNFSKYFVNPVLNPIEQVYRAQLALSAPLRIGDHYFGLRYYVVFDKIRNSNSMNMNYGFTAGLPIIHINYIGRYKQTKAENITLNSMSSQLLLSPRVVRWLRPQLRFDFDHTNNRFDKIGAYLNRRLFRTGQVSLSWEHNVFAKTNSIMLTFNFLFPFAHVSARTMRTSGYVSMNQIMRGSVKYDQTNHSVIFDRKNSVGYGSAVVRPFLDLNYNGYKDLGEEELPNLRAKVSGVSGLPRGEAGNRIYYYDRLRPYDPYMVQIDKYSLDDPMLKPTNENFEVTVNPNMVTAINVPLVIASELTGQINRRTEYGDVGIGGIRIVVVNLSKDIMSEINSFTDGEYYYLGLLPGSYRVYLDPAQIEKYGYVSQPESIEFEVKAIEGGTTIEDINFLMLPKK